MLLKVKDGEGGWHIIDDVDSTHLRGYRANITTGAELRKFQEENDAPVNLVVKGLPNGKAIEVGILEITKKGGDVIKTVFTGTIFVCNDQGRTVDRLSPGPNWKEN